MSHRSPYNERYKKDTKPEGVSKKSAASAKPKRKQAEEASSKAKSSKSKGKGSVKKAAPSSVVPNTPEYQLARKRWWIVLGVAVVILVISLGLTWAPLVEFLKFDPKILQYISLALSWIALGLVGAAWWIDLKQIRPMMKAHQAGISLEEYGVKQKAKKTKATLKDAEEKPITEKPAKKKLKKDMSKSVEPSKASKEAEIASLDKPEGDK